MPLFFDHSRHKLRILTLDAQRVLIAYNQLMVYAPNWVRGRWRCWTCVGLSCRARSSSRPHLKSPPSR